MKKNTWYEIKNLAGVAEIYIYDEIGLWGITAQDFIRDFKDITENKIDLHIDSAGGSVHMGIAIYNNLKNSGKDITTYVDGIAGSIASVIALAGNKIIVPENAIFMIHNPWMFIDGDAEELRKAADILEKIKNQIANIYVEKTGKDLKEITDLMGAESWLTGSEALELRFADEISPELKAVASISLDKFNYKNSITYKNLINSLENKKNTNSNNGDQKMTPEGIKKKYPEAHAEILKSGATANANNEQTKLETEKAIKDGIANGLKAEQDRIAGIKNLAGIPDSEKHIEAGIADLKATKASVSENILNAQKANAEKAKKNIDSDNKDLLGVTGDINNSSGDASADKDTVDRKAASDNIANSFVR